MGCGALSSQGKLVITSNENGANMNLLEPPAKKKIKDFLTDTLPTIQAALKELYPKRKLVLGDGLERLHLLYLRYRHTDSQTGKYVGHAFPLPHGDANKEWMYLEGELSGWDWSEIRSEALEKEESAEQQQRFPGRTPPFPVTHWPISLPIPRRKFPRIDVANGGWFSLFKFKRSIPCACWLMFVTEIPHELWIDIIVILIEHEVRLGRLAHISQALERNLKAKKGMLPPDRGAAYLSALIELIPQSQINNWKDTRVALSKVIVAIQRSKFFQEERYDDILENQKNVMEEKWKRLEGPDRHYRKDAARYLRPSVRDLYDYLYKHLRRLLRDDPTRFVDEDPPPAWAYGSSSIGATVSNRELFRVVGDLLRFFYRWGDFKSFGYGIEPPEWRGDAGWSSIPEEISQELAEHGKSFRKQFGKRMQAIYEQI